jgi:hypothetical protein
MKSRFLSLSAALLALPSISLAQELYDGPRGQLSLAADLGLGVFSSDRSYSQTSVAEGDRSWSEVSADVSLSGSVKTARNASFYATVGTLLTSTRGDGDAAGFTTGEEERLALEDALVGWRSGELLSELGKDGLDISFGRQNFMLGSGFLIDGDALNFGKGFDDLAAAGVAPGSLDRGGAYWLGRRHAFDRTAVVKIGADTALSGTLFWIESDNDAQASTEIAGADLIARTDRFGSFALAYIHGLSVDDDWAEFLGYTARDGQDTYNLRYDGSAFHDALTLRAEYVYQDDSEGSEYAWFGEIAWQFKSVEWEPRAGVRISDFSDGFDPLFYSFSTGYGNYAGPFNTNAMISHAHLHAYPSKGLTIGALFFDFRTADDDEVNLDGQELDLFLAWEINETFTLSPLLGLYKPDASADDGGVQLGDNDLNVYGQLVLMVNL